MSLCAVEYAETATVTDVGWKRLPIEVELDVTRAFAFARTMAAASWSPPSWRVVTLEGVRLLQLTNWNVAP